MKPSKAFLVAGFVLSVLILAIILFIKRTKVTTESTPVVSQSIDDAFWLSLDRRRSDKYREQLKSAPPVLVVRESHYTFNPTNGMGAHYGWMGGRLANLHVSFSELVGYAYGGGYARTEFPDVWTHGHLTNKFDVICTMPDHPQEALQVEAQKFLKQRFGMSWRRETKNTDVLLIRAKDKMLLESKATVDFATSTAIRELVSCLENYFSLPVIDETGATNRYDKTLNLVPARWVNGRTTDLKANNEFLARFGLELERAQRSQEWLVMEK